MFGDTGSYQTFRLRMGVARFLYIKYNPLLTGLQGQPKTPDIMKKLVFEKLMLIALMAMVAMTFSACGGSGNDDLPGTGGVTKGVHRIDVQFSESAGNCSVTMGFTAYNEKGSFVKLYDNGKEVTDNDGGYKTNVMRDISISTDDGAIGLAVGVYVAGKNMGKIKDDVTVTLVGYTNNKRVKTQTVVFPAGTRNGSITFYTNVDGTIDPIINK